MCLWGVEFLTRAYTTKQTLIVGPARVPHASARIA